ncbi:hypothetical protein TBLA_0B00850 [Henningerozyma blattae CBS 6284]|uniref:Phosphatidylserine decarboxylase proenzyme 1, mitochondrial n=1 Tax=Henningerozyma blattae (strain ATCC 34711 / CBS 6284 / DSM 70876 / NBRC 10599 / NRRL Y-10934 / UCD 77-7) TaxID=1071380 RepID=I2GXS6_HENB6|nr:hypothetical protein TBLA_0B00850 [Tetrapisispora blattae CBS 6284]CCH58928.1 hypothetical protein TBLA_0B00850 [Tetrapisispora blattae CBS 6284]
MSAYYSTLAFRQVPLNISKLLTIQSTRAYSLSKSQYSYKIQTSLTGNRRLPIQRYLNSGSNSIKSHITPNRNFRNFNRVIILGAITVAFGSYMATKNESSSNTEVKKPVRIFDNDWWQFYYSTLPLNFVSRLWGKVNSLTLPVSIRSSCFQFYSSLFNVNLDEMEDPELKNYSNLGEFFYRNLKPGSRQIDHRDNVIVSPSDGTVIQFGKIDSETGEIEQVKGMTYSIKEFLGSHDNPYLTSSPSSDDFKGHDASLDSNELSDGKKSFTGGKEFDHNINFSYEGETLNSDIEIPISKTFTIIKDLVLNYELPNRQLAEPSKTELFYAVIYLSPGDYHHYHSPVNWVCNLRRHFPGELYSVSPFFQERFPKLFVLNERVALLGQWNYGFFSMTPVGATNVGSITLNFDKGLTTNIKQYSGGKVPLHTCYESTYRNASTLLKGIPLLKGEEIGGFKLGSTVVLCFEAPSAFKFQLQINQKVKMGELIGSIEETD